MEFEIRSALVIANKRSGKGQEALGRAVEVLEAGGFAVAVDFPQSVEELRGRVETGEADVVVLAGGDGTLNAAAPALLKRDRPLGVIPMGTANDLARTLGIPTEPELAAAVIVEGALREIDLGQVNGRPYFNVASLGLSVEVARQHSGEMKRLLGVLNYPFSLWRAYRDHRPFSAEIVIDGETLRCRCTQIAVGNGRHYGGGLTMSENAEIDDGWLRVYYLRAVGPLRLLNLLPALKLGRLQRAGHAAIRRARHVEVRTKRPRTINVDGELMAETPAQFDILSKALKVFVPRAADGAGNVDQTKEEEGLLRSDRLIALQDLVEACRAAAQYYETAAGMLQEHPLGKGLSDLAKDRSAKADFFAERMKEEGDLASGPPEERAILATMVTKAKAVLGGDDIAAIRDACAQRERAILDQAISAQDTELEDDESAMAAELAEDAQDRVDRLFGNDGASST